jgi:1-acyl-sn-glycerol-3-phosphate acyltransferase
MRMHWVYYFGRGLIRFLVFSFAKWQVKGEENVPERGPLLIVSNHLHLADPPIVAASIKLKAVIMAKEELFQQRWSRFWVKNFGAFPVRRHGVDRKALRQAEQRLKQGFALIMFPEGSRSPNAKMRPALPGAALIAARLGVPILPVGISGSEKLKELKPGRRGRVITVNIGRPFRLPPHEGKLTREDLGQMTDYMMRQVAALLPPEYRGVYGGGENATDRESI